MRSPFFLVDAFVDQPFSGNPAGVVLLHSEPSSGWMQSVAEEMKQAETAFLWPREGGYGLRWFTPTVEVDLCGHATLGSAAALYDSGKGDSFVFFTRSGELKASWSGENWHLDFPVDDPVPLMSSDTTRAAIMSLFHSKVRWVGRTSTDYFAELTHEVEKVVPQMDAIARLGGRGLIITSSITSREDVDFESRFFAPQSGVPEDAVTGSAHTALAPFWSHRIGKRELIGYQASARGGLVHVHHQGDRVMLGGKARIVVRGELDLEPVALG